MNYRKLAFLFVSHCIIIQLIVAKSTEKNDILSNRTLETGTDEQHVYRQEYAKKMRSFMNQSIDPCDDFYEYACGNWKNTLKKRHINERRNSIKENILGFADLAENLLQNPDESLKIKYDIELQQARLLHESCLQADLMALPKSKEFLEVISNISGFPAIDESWNADEFDWLNATAHFSVYGVESFVKEVIAQWFPFAPFFFMPNIGFDINVRSENIRTNTSLVYILNEQRMRNYLTNYGVVEPKLGEVIDAVFELWRAVLNLTDEFNNNEQTCIEIGKMKQNNTENVCPKWINYLEIVGLDMFSELRASRCPCAYFYAKLDEIFEERKVVVANYLAMKFLYHMDAKLKDNDLKRDYCNQFVQETFAYLFDELYMASRDLNVGKQEVSLMAKQIRSIFRQELQELEWLDEETRQRVLHKESKIQLKVGRDEAPEVVEKVIREARKLQLENTSFEKIKLEIAAYQAFMARYLGLNAKNLSYEASGQIFMRGMQMQSCYFDYKINIFAGMLNPPVYHKYWPWALKYGVLGSTIGHELTHAFDAEQRDLYIAENWWTHETLEVFKNLIKCFVNKFNDYEIAEISRKIDGNSTKEENIADHAGIRYAFKAYQQHIKLENDATEEMPGFNMKPEQLFYLGFAQHLCTHYEPEHFWQMLDDPHTPDKYRVLGVLSNTPEFAEAYKCPAGSKMNPIGEKCKLW